MHRTLPLVLLLVVGCKSEDRRNAPTESTLPPTLTASTQQDLAKELDAVETRGTWSEIKRRWTGQVLRWTVTRHAALCKAEDRCNVSPFGVKRPAKYGWLPELKFAPGEFAKLKSQCGEKDTCEISIEGTLAKLDVSPDLPTNLTFTNVRVMSRTAAL